MPDPAVFGPEATDDGLRGRYRYRAAEAGDHARRAASAAAIGRAYLGHGDQLGMLEAEAAEAGYLRHRRVGHRSRAALARAWAALTMTPRRGRAGPAQSGP